MASSGLTRRMLYWGVLTVLALVILFLKILPLNLLPGRLPGPLWLLPFTYCWVLRRPEYVPAPLVAGLLLINDFMFMQPPGLMAALGVIGLEFLRTRAPHSRDIPFLFEWAMIAGVLVAIALVNHFVLALFVLTQPSVAMESMQLGTTVVFYPVIVGISTYILGVRRAAPGELDQLSNTA